MKSLTNWLRRWTRRDNRIVPSLYQVLLWCIAGILLFVGTDVRVRIPGLFEIIVAVIVIYSLFDLFQLRCIILSQVSVSSENMVQLGLEFQVATSVFFRLPGNWNQRRVKRLHRVFSQFEIDHGFPMDLLESSVTCAPVITDADYILKIECLAHYIPKKRGRIEPKQIDMVWYSPFRMWRRFHRDEAISAFIVYPDITTWRCEILKLGSQIAIEGRHIRHLVSGSQEFDYISEYTLDDEPRRINWAATARRDRTMKNVYMPEKGQHVVVAIDASRYMAVLLENGKTRFDLAVESGLALIRVAIEAGDYVSLVVFSNEIESVIIHGKGMSFFQSALRVLSGIQPKAVQGGYFALFQLLEARIHKRSFIIVLSELEGVRTDVSFLPTFSEFHRRYRAMFVTMADIEALVISKQTPAKKGFAKWTAAHWRLEERLKIVNHLRESNVSVVESMPGMMAVDIVRAYVEKRNRYLL